MENDRNPLDVKNLSSRKLWELISSDDCRGLSYHQQYLITQELLIRRHYLDQLQALPRVHTLKPQAPHYPLLQQKDLH